jgi:hypothetical protein
MQAAKQLAWSNSGPRILLSIKSSACEARSKVGDE